jgi:hypothetical protein
MIHNKPGQREKGGTRKKYKPDEQEGIKHAEKFYICKLTRRNEI